MIILFLDLHISYFRKETKKKNIKYKVFFRVSDFQKYFKSDCVCLWDVVAFLPCQHQPQRTQQAHSCGGQLWFAGRRQLARPRCQFDRLRRQLISRFLLLAPLLSAHTENIKLYYFTLNKRQISLKLKIKGFLCFSCVKAPEVKK